jgi:hypothetical protein
VSVSECVLKLVATGKITRAIGDEAMALYERSMGEFSQHMGPAQAEAAAGLATARAMESGAKKLKTDTAKQALGFANFERVALEHPDGPVAGVLDQLTASLRNRGTRNVDTTREDIWARMSSMFGDSMQKFAPGVIGVSKQQVASAKNMVREIFGASTGDQLASAAGKAWTKIREYAEQRATAAGYNFEPNENWRLPQPWSSEQVRKFSVDEFKNDFREALSGAGLRRLWDKDTKQPARGDRTDFILDRAYRDITVHGSSSAFSREMRTFEFADGAAGAEAWLKLQAKYGVGDDVFGLITGHMQRMSSEIAMAEVIAPNHRAAIAAMLPRLKAEEAKLSTLQRLTPSRIFESSSMVQRTYDVLNGRANAVEGQTLAGVLGGLRSLSTASALKNAVISAVPGDSVTTLLASSYNGIPAMRILTGVFRELSRGGEESKALASRLQIVAHGAMDFGHGYRFFQDQVAGPAQLRWLATTMIRAQGLSAWTDMMKRVFTMEFMGHLSDHTAHPLAKLREVNKPLGEFLDRYQITAKEWDAIRATAPMEVEGARFLDTEAIADQALAEKLRTGIIQERRYAILEPDARIRAITTGGLPQGTFMGELARNVFLFKSFSLTMAATHLMRIVDQPANLVKLGIPFILMHLVAGTAAIQAKNLLSGKSTEDMTTAGFWVKALAQGGGLGVYGDMLNSAFARNDRGFLENLGGPVAGAFEDVRRLTSGQARKAFDGGDTSILAEGTRIGRRYTPGTWYTKLAAERLVWDNVQMLVDKDYRGSFRRAEKRIRDEAGQQFWWAPGEAPQFMQ